MEREHSRSGVRKKEVRRWKAGKPGHRGAGTVIRSNCQVLPPMADIREPCQNGLRTPKAFVWDAAGGRSLPPRNNIALLARASSPPQMGVHMLLGCGLSMNGYVQRSSSCGRMTTGSVTRTGLFCMQCSVRSSIGTYYGAVGVSRRRLSVGSGQRPLTTQLRIQRRSESKRAA